MSKMSAVTLDFLGTLDFKMTRAIIYIWRVNLESMGARKDETVGDGMVRRCRNEGAGVVNGRTNPHPSHRPAGATVPPRPRWRT